MGIQQLHSIVTTGWPGMVGFHGHTNVYARQKAELILSGCPCVWAGPVMCFLKPEDVQVVDCDGHGWAVVCSHGVCRRESAPYWVHLLLTEMLPRVASN